jgi:hypothetical protein
MRDLFELNWYVGEVLCKGNFSHLQQKLNPAFAHNHGGPSQEHSRFYEFILILSINIKIGLICHIYHNHVLNHSPMPPPLDKRVGVTFS